MKTIILIGLLFFSPNFLFAQSDLDYFIKGFQNDESVLFQGRKMNYMTTVPSNLPIIEKLEFRTESNGFNLQNQEYLIRVSPNSLRSIKTQKQFQETVLFMTKMEMEAAKSKAIRKRYDLVINYLFQKIVLDIKLKQQLLLNDKVTLLKRSISLDDFDIMDLIEAKDDQQEINRQIMDLKNLIVTLDKVIQDSDRSDQRILIDDFDLPTINSIKKKLLKLNPVKSSSHPILKVQSAKAYNRILRYQREDANSKISLSYLQAKYAYDDDPTDSFRKSISIGIGFDIPFKNAGRLDLNELQIDIFESESEYRNLNKRLNEQKFATFNHLNNLIQKYELVSDQLKNSQSEYVLKEYQKIAETPPKAIIKLRENTLKTELLVKKQAYEIMLTYIEYLEYAGLLIQEPINNYLKEN